MSGPIIAPSILSADFSDMRSAIRTIEASNADWIHCDVMDGRFVPNLTFGPKMVADIARNTSLPLDVHLMVVEPEKLASSFIGAGARSLTFHLEACVHAHRLVQAIKEQGVKVGISIVPSTPESLLSELLPDLDLVLVMTVNPGFGGQKLIPACLEKCQRLAQIRDQRGLDFKLSVDGGVNQQTASAVAKARADILVVGSAFFEAGEPRALVSELKSPFSGE